MEDILRIKEKKYKNYDIVSNLKDVLNYISTNWVDDILIATDYKEIPENVMNGFEESGITLHIKLNEISILENKIKIIDKLGSFNVITATNKKYSNLQIIAKRAMDIFGSIISVC